MNCYLANKVGLLNRFMIAYAEKAVYDIIIFTSTHYLRWGFKQKVPRKTNVNTASKEKKEDFKKEQNKYWII